jgi:hypothetical protein
MHATSRWIVVLALLVPAPAASAQRAQPGQQPDRDIRIDGGAS